MTNHIHLIIGTKGNNKLEDIIRDFKRFTSNKLIKNISKIEESRKEVFIPFFKKAGAKNSRNNIYQLWKRNNHPIDLSDFTMI